MTQGQHSTSGGTASGWVASCSGEVVSGAEALKWLSNRAVPFDESDVAPGYDGAASWGMIRCPAHPNVAVAGDVFAVYELGEPPQRVVDLVVARAYEATVLPVLVVGSSPSGNGGQPLVTGLASWLWVEGWRTASASASLPGVSATVTAAPDSEIVWTLSTSERRIEVPCTGPGNAADSSCSVTPLVRGSGLLELRVEWTFAVSCEPACAVSLPRETTEANRPVEVAEVRGVITG